LERVTVPVPGRSYEVTVGAGLLARADELVGELPGATRASVIADAAVAGRCLPELEQAFSRLGLKTIALTIPSGEGAKTLQVYGTMLHQLATQEAHRADPVVALGGGTVGDLAGFVASTYMRGVPFIQIPTTLTAQVDAAIGGKTAVNLPEGKNLVGTFYQPQAVIADVEQLSHLAERDYTAGLAEVAKYGLTLDLDLLAMLETDPAPVLARDPEVLIGLVARCVAAKAATVAADEHDRGGRMVLNYGHTLGHALERLDAFAGRSHGEAIAIGMVFAATLAEDRSIAEPGLAARTVRLLASLGLESGGSLPPARDILDAFRMDKKFQGRVRFVLLEDVGRPVIVDDVDTADITRVLAEMGAT
jgi:3-dehydroquinate synthase